MQFDPGLDIRMKEQSLEFVYGPEVIGPVPEFRSLDAIRPSLKDPGCAGPDPVYSIAMDVANKAHAPALRDNNLLVCVVACAAGQLGDEPVRSQGHVHAVTAHSGWSPPEWIEVWDGTAILYAQRNTDDHPGTCVAVTVRAGEQVVVPPGWAHSILNATPQQRLVFAVACDRQSGIVHEHVRRRRGLAWFATFDGDGAVRWERNPAYQHARLLERSARQYPELGCDPQRSLYRQLAETPASAGWVPNPSSVREVWPAFLP